MLPLTEIVPLQPALPVATLPRWWSPAPMRSAARPPGSSRTCRNRPVFAVGDETANAAEAAGFADVRSSVGSAADLARDVAAGAPAKARLAYLCGRVRLDTLEAELAAAGLDVVGVETYDTSERCRSRTNCDALDAGGRSLRRWSIRRRALPALQGWYRRGRERSSATPRSSASRRASPGNSLLSPSGAWLAAETPDENAMFELLPKPGHHPAPFSLISPDCPSRRCGGVPASIVSTRISGALSW